MFKTGEFASKIFDLSHDDAEFNSLALDLFHYQFSENEVYREFVHNLHQDISQIEHYTQIPFLPIQFFKTHNVKCGDFKPEITFTSSGTSGQNTSRHLVKELEIYRQSFTRGFEQFYGEPAEYRILALLPSYLEREGSSLIYMANELIRQSQQPESGFFLHDLEKLSGILSRLRKQNQKVLLLGVTYALLDLAEQFPQPLDHCTIMETGGMKGRRKEMVREEVHEILRKAFEVQKIHSEYGMTELLSQAYSKGQGKFHCPPWMKVLTREVNDPLTLRKTGKAGGINVIDLANIHSCAFIATQDLGILHSDDSFEVTGRFDNSDIRGCNLMVG